MYISITHLNALLEQLQTYCCNKLPSFFYDIFSDIAFICLMQPTQPAQMQFKVFSAWKLFFVYFVTKYLIYLTNLELAGWPADLYFAIFDSSRCCSVHINLVFWYWKMGDQALVQESFIFYMLRSVTKCSIIITSTYILYNGIVIHCLASFIG